MQPDTQPQPAQIGPLWKQLIKQAELEAQYDVLLLRQIDNVWTNKELAIHLARFAEARIFAPADRHVDAAEAKLKESEAERQRLAAQVAALTEQLRVERNYGDGLETIVDILEEGYMLQITPEIANTIRAALSHHRAWLQEMHEQSHDPYYAEVMADVDAAKGALAAAAVDGAGGGPTWEPVDSLIYYHMGKQSYMLDGQPLDMLALPPHIRLCKRTTAQQATAVGGRE